MLKENIIYILAKGISGILSLTALSIVSYYWNSNLYGKFSLIILNANIISIVFFYISKIYYTRFNKEFNNRENIKEVDSIINLFIIISTVICVALTPFTENILFSLLISTVQIKFELFQEKQRINFKPVGYLISSAIKALVYLGSIVLLGNLIPDNINSIVYSYIIQFMVIIIFNYKNYTFRIQTDIPLLRKIINFGYPFLFTPLSNAILLNFYRLSIKSRFGETELGGFSYVSDLCENTIIAVMMAINLSGYPRLIKYFEEKDIFKFDKQANFNIYMHLLIFFSISISYLLIYPYVSDYVISSEYNNYVKDFFILILIASFIKGLKLYYVDHYLLLHSDKKINFISTGIYLLLNFALLPIVLSYNNTVYGVLYCSIICNYAYFILTILMININYKTQIIKLIPVIIVTIVIGIVTTNSVYIYFYLAGLIVSINRISK